MAREAPPVQTLALDRVPPVQTLAFDRVLFLRHLAIFIGAIVAYAQQSVLGIGTLAVSIVVASGALNLACSFLHRRPGLAQLSEVGSSVIGVGCWTALAAVTGGVTSPFIAGLWLEIVLAALLFALNGIVAVTLFSIVGVSGLQLWAGLEDGGMTLALQSGFLAGMGGLTYWVARHAVRSQRRLEHERDALDLRLRALGEQLERQRLVGRLGENVARLAHGLKNAVHSLRGFAALIEPTVGGREGAGAALAGLRTAIDDLEALARLSLEDKPDAGEAGVQCRAGAVVERALGEVSLAHPGVSWSIEGEAAATGLGVAMAEDELCEVLVILLRNAVEAMDQRGRGAVGLEQRDGELRIQVRDEGPGIADADLARIFEPGYTTKPQGSGYGLFLARRIVTEAGGRLAARRARPRGAILEVSLPLGEDAAPAAELPPR
jgi:signal transduction histidine kinase